MSLSITDWGQFAGVGASAALFGWMFWAGIRKTKRLADDGCVPNLPSGQPYRVYTRAHDQTLRARDVPAILAADLFLRAEGWLLLDPRTWHAKVATAHELKTAIPARIDDDLRAALEGDDPSDWAICLLIDHSGSMRDAPILQTAAAIRRIADVLVDIGAKVAVRGFSTVGWQGGKARQDWLRNGQPGYPGRLCSLLHIDYQSFGERLSDDDWAVMIHPDILRENVDGEALEWAAADLQGRTEANRVLIVLSDGAPVDDATLRHNGTAYLERHLLSVIARIESDHKIALGAVGIGFDVGRYYRRSESAKQLDAVPDAIVALIARIAAETR